MRDVDSILNYKVAQQHLHSKPTDFLLSTNMTCRE